MTLQMSEALPPEQRECAHLHNVHMQHAQEAAAKAKAHRAAGLRLEAERSIVQLQLA